MGTSPKKLAKIINKLVEQYPYRSTIQHSTSYLDLIREVANNKTAIVLYIGEFSQYNFREGSAYLHYACVQKVTPTHIYLQTAVSSFVYRGNENQELVKMSLSEFYERFYTLPRYIEHITWLPNQTDSVFHNKINESINYLLRKGVYLLYHMKILQPGLSISLLTKRA